MWPKRQHQESHPAQQSINLGSKIPKIAKYNLLDLSNVSKLI
jgi:hypothetical protein